MDNGLVPNNTENSHDGRDRADEHEDGDPDSRFPPHELRLRCHIQTNLNIK